MANNQSIEKLPPQNLEAEQSLLGSLLIDKDAIIKVADLVTEQDFYKDSNGVIFGTMKELFSRHEPIDIISLTNRLEEKGKLDAIGGRTYLTTLANANATSSNIAYYAKIVQRKATLRRMMTAASEIGEMSFNEEEDVDKLLDEAEQKLFGVSQKYLKNVFVPIDNLLNEASDRID